VAGGGLQPDQAAFVAWLPEPGGVRGDAWEGIRNERAKQVISVPENRGRSTPEALRTITALLVLRDQVLRPILAGVRVPRRGRKPATWTRTDQHYETLRLEMQVLFNDLGIAA
jgi:hypothetical protein